MCTPAEVLTSRNLGRIRYWSSARSLQGDNFGLTVLFVDVELRVALGQIMGRFEANETITIMTYHMMFKCSHTELLENIILQNLNFPPPC